MSTGVGVGVGVGFGVSVGACVRECVCARLLRGGLGNARVLLSNSMKNIVSGRPGPRPTLTQT